MASERPRLSPQPLLSQLTSFVNSYQSLLSTSPLFVYSGLTSFVNNINHCADVDNGLDNTCEVIRQETVLFSTPEIDYIIYD